MFNLFPSDTVALEIGPLVVHWYGVMYVLGFLIGLFLLKRLQHFRSLELTSKQIESLFLHVFLGVVVGGRIGFVLFYGGSIYWSHPLMILEVWNGGMASHGGFIGVGLAIALFCRRHRVNIFALLDVVVVPVAVGLALGRLGNLINGELYGTVTTLPWGMHFSGAEGLRHPTQIYAICKDLFIAALCFFSLKKFPPFALGVVTSYFLLSYSLLRFVIETFRDQPDGYTNLLGLLLSRGQLLSIPLFLIGILVFFIARTRASRVLP